MPLGLKNSLSIQKLTTPGIVTDNLVLKHKYDAGSVVPVSDGAAYFDGTDDYITMGDITSFDGSDTLSLCCWAYLTDANIQEFITKGYYNNSGSSFNFRYDLQSGTDSGAGRLNFSVGNDVYAYKSSAGYTVNRWYHFAVTYSNTADEIWFYVDGVRITPNSSGAEAGTGTPVSIPNTSKELRIGNGDGASNYTQGYICNAGAWTSVLTQPQIKSIMNKNYAGLTDSEKTNLVSWWNLDESHETNVTGQGPIVYDNHHSGSTIYGDELLNWDSNFIGTGISTGNVGDFITNANNSTTFTYIDNDNKTLRLQTDSDGDHVQIKHQPSSAILEANSAYKMVVTVTSLTGRWRIRPAADDPDADMTAPGTYTFLWNSSDSTYWRVERDTSSQVNDITISDVKIYKINGNVGLLV
tara:strand:+ start:265 stop:1497 length:1233 start_codon:yes stop_codon:yes gene_type:complete